jgi:hypothetical protein
LVGQKRENDREMTLDELGKALLRELSEVVNGGDDQVRPDPSNFVPWCTPGLTFEVRDSDFDANGLGSGGTGKEEKQLQQAFSSANLADFIPDFTAVYSGEEQDGVWWSSQPRLSYMHGEILRSSKAADKEPTPEQIAEVDRLRRILWVTRKSSVGSFETPMESPMVEECARRMNEVIVAKMAHNKERALALAAVEPEGKAAVADFSMKASLCRMQARNVENKQASIGFKNEVDTAHAKINQITPRSVSIWKQRLRDAPDDAKSSTFGPGQEFCYTGLMLGNLMSLRSWQTYSVSHEKLTATKTH